MSFPLDHPIVTDGNHHRTTYGTDSHPAGSKRPGDPFSGDEKFMYHFLNVISKFVFKKQVFEQCVCDAWCLFKYQNSIFES